jgi:hypothetical protein
MDDKIKAKAQEVRLALLDRLHGIMDCKCITAKEDELRLLSEASSILNQLDPSAHGLGSYGTLLASADEISGVGGYSTK